MFVVLPEGKFRVGIGTSWGNVLVKEKNCKPSTNSDDIAKEASTPGEAELENRGHCLLAMAVQCSVADTGVIQDLFGFDLTFR